MPEYNYRVIDKNGNEETGSKKANNQEVIVNELKNEGYYIIEIKQIKKKQAIFKKIKLFSKVKKNILIVFSQQLALMLKAGIPLLEAINIIKNETNIKHFKNTLNSIETNIEKGENMAQSLANFPEVFPELYVQMVKAGESSGQLIPIIQNLGKYYRRQDEIKNEIMSSLYYPLIILIIAILIIVFLIGKILPQFLNIMQSLGGEIVMPTLILIKLGDYFRNYWLLNVLITIIIIYSFYQFKQTYLFDKLVLKLPIFKKIMQKVITVRFVGTLSLLLTSGLDILTSLNIMENIMVNEKIKNHISSVEMEVEKGIPIAEALDYQSVFPKMMIEMLKIGEKSGKLDEMLQYLEIYYQKKLRADIGKKINLIEPLMIIGLTLVVGFIVISVLLPMFNLYAFM